MSAGFGLGVALDGAGWHPGAWRVETARPSELFDGAYWATLARTAEDAGVDLLTIEDQFGLQSRLFDDVDPSITGEVRGRLDAVLLANWLAPLTSRIGLIPTVATTHTEPFHVSTAIATLDYASQGRAGWRPVASAKPSEAALVGRRTFPALRQEDIVDGEFPQAVVDRFAEADDAIEVVRRLWDSWADDAVIRDVATGRYIDRDRLNHIDFEGDYFSVKGPSITPRPPQGQPIVAVLAHAALPYRLAARQADVVFVTPHDDAGAARIVDEVRAQERDVDRLRTPLRIWADVIVVLEDTEEQARRELARLDALAGTPITSDAVVIACTAETVVQRLEAWRRLGIEGARLRPARLPEDLDRIARDLVPALQETGLRDAADARPAGTLRSRLGLPVDTHSHTTARSAVA
ncbi:FMNH2-utilizing monooxygenase [Microbacterium mangrovi]|uniref:FMNH2-utilizing monooxygenase n=1 Tax=Microbacterium mangrovi TaxID=1348253 RepID=A0A0B1ZZF8_9MICO|nr:LLM class flavin-dependent oxidoreductase [Microbacterium mangrovi]KHK96620.1 FMNH2-utilizing monooxygenase [Microbacterium mangrovi]